MFDYVCSWQVVARLGKGWLGKVRLGLDKLDWDMAV
jgi:hypothetical protein